MLKSLDAFRYQLLDKIMMSESESDAKRFITEAIKLMKGNLVNVNIIFHFFDSILDKMEEIDSMDIDSSQRKIIKAARLECKRQIKTLDFRRQK